MTHTRRLFPIFLGAILALAPATVAAAVGIRSPVPVAVRARLDIRLVMLQDAGEWDVTSRSPADPSRFMADITAGNASTGTLYLKGASDWNETDDALGRVDFTLEQGDYLRAFAIADSTRLDARLFGDERRFFTGELGTEVVDDDDVARFEHRLGARIDVHGHTAGGTYWIAGLDDGGDTRVNQYAAARLGARPAFVGFGYVHDHPESGEDHAITKVEAAGFFQRATALVSYEQSGFGDGVFLPAGDWHDRDGGGYTAAAPDNSAATAEVRTRRTLIGENHLVDASYRYGSVGSAYVNDLTSLRPGSVSNTAWVDWAHRRYALDARLEVADVVQSGAENSQRRGANLTARARFKNNGEALLRAGAVRDQFEYSADDRHGFVHAAYTRELKEFLGSAHVLVDQLGRDAVTSAGGEVRVNWNPTSAVYARWIVSNRTGTSDAVFVRFEFRPTARTWVTVGYGRDDHGDDVYFLEDRDAFPSPQAGDVVTITVRGDL